jgi:hypothetical protein
VVVVVVSAAEAISARLCGDAEETTPKALASELLDNWTLPRSETPAVRERAVTGTAFRFWVSEIETVPLVYVETRARTKAALLVKERMMAVVEVLAALLFTDAVSRRVKATQVALSFDCS